VTAVPLLLFAAGARRIPFSTLGLLQYLGPSLQLLIGVWLYREPFAYRAPGYVLIWIALASSASKACCRAGARAPPAAEGDRPVAGAKRRAVRSLTRHVFGANIRALAHRALSQGKGGAYGTHRDGRPGRLLLTRVARCRPPRPATFPSH